MKNATPQPSISLSFKGDCEEAFRFYERALEGKLAFTLTWGDSPMADQAPPDWRGKLLHATLVLGNATLHGSDAIPGTYGAPRGFSITLSVDEPDRAERIFAQLSENGTITVPLQQTFWSLRFGAVTDRFGIPWDINCEKTP